MIASAGSQRFLMWASIAAAGLFAFGYVGLTGFFPPPPPDLTAVQVAELYASDNLQLRLGVVLCLVAGGFGLPWSVVVSIQMARHEKGLPVWAITQLVAGALGTLPLVLPPLFWGVAAFSASRDPALTLLMHELAFLTFITPVSFVAFQGISIIAICFSKKDESLSAFPRWLGYVTAWLLASAEVGVLAQLFKSGPFAWNGLFPFWIPLSLFSIWFGLIAFTVLRAITRQQHALHEATA